MSLISIAILTLLSLAALPLYFHRFGATGTIAARIGAIVLLVLLGLAALAALLGRDDLGPVVFAFTVSAAALGGGPVTVAILRSSYRAEHRCGRRADLRMDTGISMDTGATGDTAVGSGIVGTDRLAPAADAGTVDDAGDGAERAGANAGAERAGANAGAERAGANAGDDSRVDDGSAVLRGGAWIGVLERIAICVTLLAGWPEGMAVVLAVKGLGRYSELGKSVGAAERFILGTFASVLWAAAVTGVGLLSF